METYRSGHNGADSKSVVPSGTVGSNPTVSANIKTCIYANNVDAGFLFIIFVIHKSIPPYIYNIDNQ